MMNGTEAARPLAGVKVVELGVWVAAPAACGIMADWGADVIKVEPPTGDPQRQAFRALGMDEGRMAPFELDNRSKRSVVLNLREQGDADRMLALLATADIFITNVRIDALERLGLGVDTVLARFPRLIYGRVTGYGAQGPDRDRAGYDVGAFWARSGMATEFVPRGTAPYSSPPALGDHITGVTMVSGVMAALYRRERTGVGGLVDASLLRTGLYALSSDITMQQNFGKSVAKRPRADAATPMVNCYRAKDDRWLWLLGVEAARHWPKLVKAIERPDLLDNPKFKTTRDQVANRKELIAEIDREIAKHDRQYWQERFDEFDLWWAPVQSLEDVLADPQAIHSGAFVEIPGHGDFAPIPSVAGPIDFDGFTMTPRGPSPSLGQHSEEVLGALQTTNQEEI